MSIFYTHVWAQGRRVGLRGADEGGEMGKVRVAGSVANLVSNYPLAS